MSTRCTGFERWGMRLRVNERFRGLNGDQHGLRSQEMDKGPSDLTAWPIAPAHRLSRNRRGGWYLFSRRRRLVRLGDRHSTCWRGGHRRCGARPEHCTHPSRLERRARFLTLFAQQTGAAVANAGGIQHAQGAVTFWPTFLHKERMACWAAQRPIGLRGKHGTRKPMRKGGSRPVRWPVGRWPIQRVLRGLGFVCRESRREAKPRGQRERFRQREEQHLGKREEKEEDRHREGTWAAPEPANRPSPSRASWSPVRAAPTPSEGSRSTG